MLDPTPSGGGEGRDSFGAMLKKNKEFNVFHHVWSHLTTSPNACLSSPSDPRCVQPMLQVTRKKEEEKASNGNKRPVPQDTKDDGRSLSYGSPDPSSKTVPPGGVSALRRRRPPASVAQEARRESNTEICMKAAKISPRSTRDQVESR